MQGSTFGYDIHSEYILFTCYVAVESTEKCNTVFTYSCTAIYFLRTAMQGSSFGSDIHSEHVICDNLKHWEMFLVWEFKTKFVLSLI